LDTVIPRAAAIIDGGRKSALRRGGPAVQTLSEASRPPRATKPTCQNVRPCRGCARGDSVVEI